MSDDRPLIDNDSIQPGVWPVAVIDIGASSIRMAIAEIHGGGNVRILERLVQGVSLGKDTFTNGSISKRTIEMCVKVLRAYQQKLTEYQILHPDQIRVVATSAVREARNRMSFLDRIYTATGLTVHPIDGPQIARITYLGIRSLLGNDPSLAGATNIIAEVGGGSTDVLILSDGSVIHSHTYTLGSMRLRGRIESFGSSGTKTRQLMESRIDRTIQHMQVYLQDKTEGTQLIALGGDIRFAASQLEAADPSEAISVIKLADLEAFTDKVLRMGVDGIIQKFHLSLPDAETLGPALLSYVRIATELGLDEILLTDFTLRDALLNEMSSKLEWSDELVEQVTSSSLDLGRRYSIDEPHAMHVSKLAIRLFDTLLDEHRLSKRFEVILRAAALLHEVGLFVNTRAYHKHSLYLITNGEVFGLTAHELLLVALVARYHRRASPKTSHDAYMRLDRRDRIAVCKLAAILRVADALDHSRSQRVQKIQSEVTNGQLVVSVEDVEELSLEQMELKRKGGLFEETYGLQVLLRRKA